MIVRRIIALGLSLAVFGCAPTMRIKPGEIPAAEIPATELKSQAEYFVKAHVQEENYDEITSGPELARVNRIVERLARAANYPAKTFPVHLVDAGTLVNAAAFNGASIVVYSELLKKVPSDDELATVLGHEVGHIVAKHYKDQEEEQKRATAVDIGSSVFGTLVSVATSVAGLGGVSDIAGDAAEGVTGAVGYGAFVGSFSRVQEYEADHLGLLIMARAGFDPRVAPKFWAKSDKVFGASSSEVGAFFGTHPAEGNRREELEKAMPLALALYKSKK